eukprot:gene324-biopygen81
MGGVLGSLYYGPALETYYTFVLEGGERKVLGRGAFATVYIAERRKDVTALPEEAGAGPFAIKAIDKIRYKRQLPPGHSPEQHLAEEADIMRSFDHPNIIRLFEIFEDDRFWYASLELCYNGDLAMKLDDRVQMVKVSERDVIWWMRQMVEAVAALHRLNVCHRDIKPANFFCRGYGFISPLKLGDFGIAVRFETSAGKIKKVVGTPAYMSPEMINASKGYGISVDVWSLGVILMQLLNRGRHPFLANGNRGLDRQRLLTAQVPPDIRFRNGRCGFCRRRWGTRWSAECRSILLAMITIDPSRRITADQCLAAPWWTSVNYDPREFEAYSVPRPGPTVETATSV